MIMFPQPNETQRLQYLQALGVTSWLPTQPLVGSLYNDVLWQHEDSNSVSLTLEPVQTQAIPTQSNPDQNMQPTVETQAQAVALALGGLGTTIEVAPANISESPVADCVAANLSPVNVAPMHLGLSWYSSGVLVINDVPVQDGAAMSSPIQRLQTAIVNTLSGFGSPAMPVATAEFNWPLVPGPHGDHSLAGAKSGLTYSLAKLLQDKDCHQVLVMGPAPIQLLQPHLALGQASQLEIGSQSVAMVYSHSLHQLLAVPSLKAEVWAHLQPLLTKE